MLKKCTFRFLFTVLAMAGVSAAATITPVIPNKDGDNCYLISDAAELYGFAAIVNGTIENRDAEPTACGKLDKDIVVNTGVLTLAGELNKAPEGGFIDWTPIGTADNESADNWFSGTFDGQGHTISGLYFNDHEEGLYVGLFGYIGSAEETVSISNVGIEDSYFNALSAVGGVVGWVENVALNMENVYNAAVVVGASFVGGVVGFVGFYDPLLTLNMVNVYNVGSVNCDDEEQAGGLVGYFSDAEDTKITIKNSYNYGTVGGGNSLVGTVESDYEDAVIETNSFYLGSSSSGVYGEFKSATDFSNGTVYAALHSAEDGEVWRQYKNDAYPTLVAKTGTPMHTVVLHYSETDSVAIAYTEGEMLMLPKKLSDESILIWYKDVNLSGSSYTLIANTENGDLNFYAKVMKLDDDGYYEIANADMLFKFAELVNTQNSTYGSAKVKLTEDIVVNQNVLKNASGESCVNDDGSYNTTTCPDLREWTPIGEGSYSFNGSFDGQGHTISGLYINEPVLSSYGYNALFANVGGTSVTIKNVGIEDSYFSGHRYVGGIVGRSIASSLIIENCYNAATLYGIYGLGGLVGELNSGDNSLTIENSYSFGTIKFDTSSGGIPGQTGALVGEDQRKTEVLNSFYLEQEGVESKYGTAASSEAFGDGTVALLLHGDGASVWGQKVGTDSHPNFYKGIEGATPSENGPGVITGGPATPLVTLTYPDGSDSTFTYVEGWGAKLPEKDKEGNDVIWYDENNLFYIDVSSTADGNLNLHAVVFQPGDDDVYVISDAASLYKFAAIVNGGNSTAKAKLENDFVVNENVLATAGGVSNVDATTGDYIGTTTGLREWTPINNFNGTFDGQGHSISGLYFNDENVSNVGLFGSTLEDGEDASIKNVGVEDSYFRGKMNVGGILGYVEIGAIANIKNVYNAAVVVGSDYVGGIIGCDYGTESHVANAYNVGSVLGDNCVGGIVGYNYSDNESSIENSYNYGNVSGNSDVGPLVGKMEGYLSVTNSYYLGDAENGDYGTNMTSTEFANRTVLDALNPAEGDAVWEQGEDYPVLLVFSNSDDEFKPNADGYYEIATADDLYKFAEIVNNGTAVGSGTELGVKAKLIADICVNACGEGESVLGTDNANVNATTGEYTGTTTGLREWTPIGNEDNPFKGSFDGQGHTISGLYFKDINAEEAGLFGDVNGTVSIDNVGLVDSYIKAGLYAGGLVGYAQGSLTINNSYNASSVNAPGQTFGGLVGAASLGGSSLAISNSYNVGPLNGKGYGGGLVGFANELVVTNSYNAGSIYNSENGAFVGGITSLVNGATTITNCFNYGVISYPSNISVTVDDLVAEVDNNAEVTVTNSFTIGESVFDGATKVTSDKFSDGTVLIALRSGEGGYVWVQASGDKYPSIDINATSVNTIVLDWTSAAYSTTLADEGYMAGAVVVVKGGKQFYADGKIYEGILSAEQVAAIGDNKLYPISGVELENVSGKLVATLDGDSKESVMIPTDVAVDKVIYKRDVLNSTYATIMLPFSVSLTNLSDFTFYKFASMAENKNGYRYVAQVSWVKDMLEANTPYIMVPKNSVSEIQFEAGASAKFTLNTTTGSRKVSTEDGAWEMTGVYEYKVWEEGNTELGRAYGYTAASADGYKIGQFAKLGAGASIQPMRMYLIKTSKSAPLGRPGLSGAFAQTNDLPETIGIEIVDNEEQTMLVNRISVVPTVVKSNCWFDMKGRALGGKPTTKGTYYYNGKRVIIK